VRRAAASIVLLCTKAFIFLKPAITDIGTALRETPCYLRAYISRKILCDKLSRFGPKTKTQNLPYNQL
jgi:hypothetical protein